MNIDEQIKKTKQVIDERLTDLIDCNELILENQLLILELLKELTHKPDRAHFGPG
jgi:hypothetical protein